MDWGFTIAVVITGIVVVFVVLTILVMLCTGMGAFFGTENQAPKVEPKPTPTPQPVVEKAPTPQPAIEEGISGEVVAAISASLAIILGEESSNYQVSSIKHATVSEQTNKRASKTAWSTAGFVENTRPF